MKARIRKMDHSGDSIMATYETENAESIKVAQDELEKFLADCVSNYGPDGCPPVWARRCDSDSFSPVSIEFGPKPKVIDDLRTFNEVLTQYPLVAG